MNTFVDRHQKHCTRAEMLTFMYMWRHADRSNNIELSVSHLAQQLDIDRRTAQRALEALAERNLITKTYTGGLNKGANRYLLTAEGL